MFYDAADAGSKAVNSSSTATKYWKRSFSKMTDGLALCFLASDSGESPQIRS